MFFNKSPTYSGSSRYVSVFREYRPRQLSRYTDSLRAGRSGDRMLVGTRFSAPVQTSCRAHPASYAMGTGCLSRGVKRSGRDVNHPPSSKSGVKERVELYLYSPSEPSWPVPGLNLPYVIQQVLATRHHPQPINLLFSLTPCSVITLTSDALLLHVSAFRQVSLFK